MSENFKNLLKDTGISQGSATARREAAVTAALTLIHAKAASPDSINLEYELGNLSGYADKIQAALKANDK
ncbi:hypothetical protein [Pseudomonas sp. ACN5]|uniref:hypothetical protein n=1 Tax=Pseudomonas sp. ACN5 TaxID=1920427 RepID=UPI000BB3563F|nr:hypothetical protein [Pseudomonas sp. ACN5]PBJ02091.1 hypothetical protein BSF40_51900 [Pseudomonas sp. ACN5]